MPGLGRYDVGAPIPQVPGSYSSSVGAYTTNTLRGISAQIEAARATTAAASAGTTDPNNFVYWGTEEQHVVAPPGRGSAAAFRERQGTQQVGKVRSIDDIMADFESWSMDRKRKVAKQLVLAGFFGNPNQGETVEDMVRTIPLQDVHDAYLKLLQETNVRNQQGVQVTPNDLLHQFISYNKQTGLFPDPNDPNAPGSSPYANKTITRTDTSKSVDIWSPLDARALARATVQRELGRDPTEAEFEDFVAALQTKQRQNPAITHTSTTTQYDQYGSPTDTNTSSRTTGGVTAAGMGEVATQQAQSNPGWAEWQAVGTYFPALLSMMGAGVPGV